MSSNATKRKHGIERKVEVLPPSYKDSEKQQQDKAYERWLKGRKEHNNNGRLFRKRMSSKIYCKILNYFLGNKNTL